MLNSPTFLPYLLTSLTSLPASLLDTSSYSPIHQIYSLIFCFHVYSLCSSSLQFCPHPTSIFKHSALEYYSAIKKNTFESVLMRWMKLEPIIQSEVSQKDKDQYSILTHIYMEFRKMVMITLYARQLKRHRCKEQSFGLCGRR